MAAQRDTEFVSVGGPPPPSNKPKNINQEIMLRQYLEKQEKSQAHSFRICQLVVLEVCARTANKNVKKCNRTPQTAARFSNT